MHLLYNFSTELSKVKDEISYLNKSIKIVETRTKAYFSYDSIGKFGHFQKLKRMNYKTGQTACSKIYGHIIEFNENSPNYKAKLKAIVDKFKLNSDYDDFYVGLDRIGDEKIWKWSNTGRTF